MKKNYIIILLIIILSIGFATLTTTLIINGKLNIAFNEDDFDIYFSEAKLNGVNKSDEFIVDNKKKIKFKTDMLVNLGDRSVLYYEVTNKSREYDAEVKLVCDNPNNIHYSLTNVLNQDIIKANSVGDGVLVVELTKVSTDEQYLDITCEIIATPIERTTTNDTLEVNKDTYNIYGYFVDDKDKIIPNANLVIVADKLYYSKSDSRGYVLFESLPKGSYEVYYLDPSIEDITNLSLEEIKGNSITSSSFAYTTKKIIFTNNDKIVDSVIEPSTNNTYEIILKLNNGEIINDHFEVTHNKPYGNLPAIDVINCSFIHWELEDGTIITNDSLVATKERHTLTAVISQVIAPTIKASTTDWTESDVTISIEREGVAEKGIKYYEYFITTIDNPSNETLATGTTLGNIVISNSGTHHVFYRTVANDGIKSSWSTKATTRIDRTAPTNIGFSNKVNTNETVTFDVNYTEEESSIEEIKCYYGDSNSQTLTATSNDGKCEYPSTAEYAKVCVVNSINKEACSPTKQLATYFIKNGIPQVPFSATSGVTVTINSGYYTIKNSVFSRSGIYTTNKYDFTSYGRMYVDASYNVAITADLDAAFTFIISQNLYNTYNPGNEVHINFYRDNKAGTLLSERKVVSKSANFSGLSSGYLQYMKNDSSQNITCNIYNAWLQLKD